MLEVIPADDRDLWRSVGIILGREFKRSDEAWQLYVEWAAKWDGQKGRGHDEIMHQCFHKLSQESSERELSLGTIVKAAMENGWVPKKGQVPKANLSTTPLGIILSIDRREANGLLQPWTWRSRRSMSRAN